MIGVDFGPNSMVSKQSGITFSISNLLGHAVETSVNRLEMLVVRGLMPWPAVTGRRRLSLSILQRHGQSR
jgi:hypothetical protein